MASPLERRVYWLAGIGIVTALGAIALPRFVASGEGGLAAAATAALVFLALLAAAAAIAIAAMALTIRHYSSLALVPRLAGIVPAIVIGGALVWIVLYLRY
jgi:hypothetical protein